MNAEHGADKPAQSKKRTAPKLKKGEEQLHGKL